LSLIRQLKVEAPMHAAAAIDRGARSRRGPRDAVHRQPPFGPRDGRTFRALTVRDA
jgi:hypothetical protein